MAKCNCIERQKEHPSGESEPYPDIKFEQFHDCEYVKERNALIPLAERLSWDYVEKAGIDLTEPAAAVIFTRKFVQKMDDLYYETRQKAN